MNRRCKHEYKEKESDKKSEKESCLEILARSANPGAFFGFTATDRVGLVQVDVWKTWKEKKIIPVFKYA